MADMIDSTEDKNLQFRSIAVRESIAAEMDEEKKRRRSIGRATSLGELVAELWGNHKESKAAEQYQSTIASTLTTLQNKYHPVSQAEIEAVEALFAISRSASALAKGLVESALKAGLTLARNDRKPKRSP